VPTKADAEAVIAIGKARRAAADINTVDRCARWNGYAEIDSKSNISRRKTQVCNEFNPHRQPSKSDDFRQFLQRKEIIATN